MKKYLILAALFIAVCPLSLFANDWGVFAEYENNPQKFALYKIIDGAPIKYLLTEVGAEKEKTNQHFSQQNKNKELLKNLNNELKTQQREKELSAVIEQSFYSWLKGTKNMIIKEGRANEFADIMPILNKKIILQKVNTVNTADISFFFTTAFGVIANCGKNNAACFQLTKPWQIVLINPFSKEDALTRQINKKYETLAALTHEIGHYFALSDQYKDTGADSLTYSTFNRITAEDSVMGSNRTEILFCDDVDGFINLIDLTLYLKTQQWSDRAQRGWASFCNGKKNIKNKPYKYEFYKKAKLLNKSDYTRNGKTYHYDAEGNLDDGQINLGAY